MVILGIPNKKNEGAFPSFSWNACTSIQMLQKLFGISRAHTCEDGNSTHGAFDHDS
jgi:hypothetical protein